MSIADNLSLINTYKGDIKEAIENKGVDMTGVPLSGYAGKIGEISGEGYTPDDIATRNISGNITITASFIKDYAFTYCSSLTSVNMPNVTSIGVNAFSSCTSLTSVSIPKVTSIPQYCFAYCGLSEFKHSQVSNLANFAFYVDAHLLEVDCPNVDSVNMNTFGYCSLLTSVNLPNVKYIGSGAFMNCSSLTSVNIPIAHNMYSSAFQSCRSLKEINIPAVNQLYGYTFSSCSSLESVTIGTELYYVATLQSTTAFSYTPMVNSTYLGHFGSIYVPASLVDAYKTSTNWSVIKDRIVGVGDPSLVLLSYSNNNLYGQFRLALSSTDLTRLKLTSTSALLNVDLPNVTEINSSAFSRYGQLVSVNLPNVTSIGSYAFVSCTSLSSVNLPNVKYIGSYAFSSCNKLTEISLHNVSYVGGSVFNGCTRLESIYIGMNNSNVVDLFHSNAFAFTPIYASTYLGHFGSIYVPASLVEAYKTASYWSYYKSRIAPIPE